MSDATATTPHFEKSARELAERLERDPRRSELAVNMAREARQLEATFAGWAHQRPDETTKIATIGRLFDLNRRAMDFLSGGPTSGRRKDDGPGSGR